MSGIKFSCQIPRVNRFNTHSHVDLSLPSISNARAKKYESYTPIKLKYIKSQEQTCQPTTTGGIQTARKRTIKRRAHSQMDEDIEHMNEVLIRIRKQIANQRQEYLKRGSEGVSKSIQKIKLADVTPYKDEDDSNEEQQKVYYYRKPEKMSRVYQKYIFKPVWKKETQSPRRVMAQSKMMAQSIPVKASLSHITLYGPNSFEASEEHSNAQEEHLEKSSNLGQIFPLIGEDKSKSELRELQPQSPSILTNSQKRMREHHSVVRTRPKQHNPRVLKNFRKIVNVVLFTIYLRTFNQRMHLTRKTLFDKYLKTELKAVLLDLKQTLLQYSTPFFQSLIDKSSFDYHIDPNQSHALKMEKINAVKKLLNYQLQCLKPCIRHLSYTQKYAELFYFLCKHGNYSCLHSIHTPEELNVMCISPTQGYVSASQHLQKSNIISLLLIKIMLYNVFFSSESVKIALRSPIKRHTIRNNIALVGNVLYQLFIDIQDELLEQSPAVYTVGNWTKLQHRFNFKVADNMTVREGVYQTNQLISGLMDRNVIRDIYCTKQMQTQKSATKALLEQMHRCIRRYHLKIRERCFIK